MQLKLDEEERPNADKDPIERTILLEVNRAIFYSSSKNVTDFAPITANESFSIHLNSKISSKIRGGMKKNYIDLSTY